MALEQIRSLVAEDFESVNDLIRAQLASDVALVNQLSHYIVNSGGKRLRPVLVLLAAKACKYTGRHHIDLAAIVEFIHTATLLHDDVVDASQMRRGRETVNAIWGNQASVLVGDFLYSRAFQMMVRVGDMRVMEIVADATNRIAEGEVLQLVNCNDPDTTEDRYMNVIEWKTATLFEAGAMIGATIAEESDEVITALGNYGRKLGMAYQLIDDVLDYSASFEKLGKNIGDDLAEGKPTLPLIYAIRTGDPDKREIIRNAIETGGREQLAEVMSAISQTGALDYARDKAHSIADEAISHLDVLPASAFRDALIDLSVLLVKRDI
ncbi:MAG: octaprenyl diphosphate synthase [Gammaproteobacteria bacterium]|nr:octaprenyl diphosphate synthase [Gammaproteobacteria bacterium]